MANDYEQALMNNNISSGKMEFTLSFQASRQRAPRRVPEGPFRILLLGDFSGRQNRGLCEGVAGRKPWKVDCDNFENIPARMEASLNLPSPFGAGESWGITFATLEDFHPDRLLKQVKPLARLVECRKRLLQPATADAAAADLESLLKGKGQPETASQPVQPKESADDTLSRLLGKPVTSPESSKPAGSGSGFDVQNLIRNIIGTSPAPAQNPRQDALLSAVDTELTTGLRAILHHPDFQSLESAWREADLLVRNFGGEEQVQVFLLNLSKGELAADLQNTEDLGQSGFFRILSSSNDGEPWGAFLGHYSFGSSLEDFALLGRLAKISATLTTPFIAAGLPDLAGCSTFAEQPDPMNWRQGWSTEITSAWSALRAMPEAAYLALAMPRFLLRQPYGADSDPIEAFAFSEITGSHRHESFLWGNSAVLVGLRLAESFQSEGWEMSASGFAEVADLPVYRFKEDGETLVKPCAEAWLSERTGEMLDEKGFVPVLSIKGRDAVKLANLRALQSGSSALAGGWERDRERESE
jgi:type VI secretion system protein ImpC